MYTVVPAVDLVPERDVFMGLPVETTNKQTFHRVPIRSACTESPSGDRRTRVQIVPGNPNVVQSCVGLQRLLVRFPSVFVPGIKVFEAGGDSDRTNLSMGFAMYDYRAGPTPEEQRVLDNVDSMALFLRTNMMRCDKIRRALKLGPDNMSVPQQQLAAEMMDLHIVRPAMERQARGHHPQQAQQQHQEAQVFPSRYCYVKLVSPDPHVNEVYHTYFWTEDGKRIPFETVVGFRNFRVEPFVEIEDVFVSKAVRAPQLKLRECIVVPPTERIQSRFSVCFPDRVCRKEEEEDNMYAVPAVAATLADVADGPQEPDPAPPQGRDLVVATSSSSAAAAVNNDQVGEGGKRDRVEDADSLSPGKRQRRSEEVLPPDEGDDDDLHSVAG
jgi:hypothetical protein